MARPKDSKYDAYARHRIAHRLLELYPRFGSWAQMAEAITDFRKVPFARTDLNRVRNCTAGDAILDNLMFWLENLDPDFRETLHPDAIFSEVGVSARDYYFHLFSAENLDEWDEMLLAEFEGVYLCAPEEDANSYMPLSRVRELLINKAPLPQNWRSQRSSDIRQYISQRSFLILRRTSAHYYQAAEIPMGSLFPAEFQSMDILSFYEGVGIASSNTIHVFLRECLSRVPKLHSILIRPKASFRTFKFRGGDIYADTTIRHLAAEFSMLTDADIAHMAREFSWQIESDVFLRGTSQSNISPLAFVKNRVETVFGKEQVYHRKPDGFLNEPDIHFIHPEIDIGPQLRKLIDNPLVVGELLGRQPA